MLSIPLAFDVAVHISELCLFDICTFDGYMCKKPFWRKGKKIAQELWTDAGQA